jgi:hypothetical protein
LASGWFIRLDINPQNKRLSWKSGIASFTNVPGVSEEFDASKSQAILTGSICRF